MIFERPDIEQMKRDFENPKITKMQLWNIVNRLLKYLAMSEIGCLPANRFKQHKGDRSADL